MLALIKSRKISKFALLTTVVLCCCLFLSFYLSMEHTIESKKEFLKGFTMGITGVSVALWGLLLIFNAVKNYRQKKSGELTEKNKYQFFLSIGMFCLVSGILLNRFGGDNAPVHIAASVLLLTSIPINVLYLRKYHRVNSDPDS